MDIRIERLITAFENNGWVCVGSSDAKIEWWFEDMFVLMSQWRPAGLKLYLTLIVDPQIEKRKEVWAVGLSSTIPETWTDKNLIRTLNLNEIKKTDLDQFVKDLNKIILK